MEIFKQMYFPEENSELMEVNSISQLTLDSDEEGRGEGR